MTLLSSKKPPFEKTTSSDDKPKVTFTEKSAQMILGVLDHNYGLTPLEICWRWQEMKKAEGAPSDFQPLQLKSDEKKVYKGKKGVRNKSVMVQV